MRSVEQQLDRLQRIEPVLRCPLCGGRLLRLGNEAYQSEGCGTRYSIDHGVPILLSPTQVAQGLGRSLPSELHASTHPYSLCSDELIAQFNNGLVLDLGAGGKHIEYHQVVQVDVFRFPMVDVVASADALPFRADVFDAVISQAVFEHLQYPEAAAAEIWRTLKPDGVTKVDTAFLQPEHAYPHHYFNATEAGLRHWFRDFELQWSGVEQYQHPKWALLWLLDVYLAALPPSAQDRVLPVSVKECIDALQRLQCGEGVTPEDLTFGLALDQLAPDSARKLAAGVSVKAVKRVAMPGIGRQRGAVQLELERRLHAQGELIEQDQAHRKVRAEIDLIEADRTRFLLHEYELNRRDPLVNPGVLRPLLSLLVREVRQRVPESFWQGGQHYYRRWRVGTLQPSTVQAIRKALVTFWVCPQTHVGLLDQFFSLIRQTHGDWVYLLQSSSMHSAAMQRLMWELQQRDARVLVLTEADIKLHLSSVVYVRLAHDALLAFDAVRELATLLQRYPHVECITSDTEKWGNPGERTMRCWGMVPDDIAPSFGGEQVLVNPLLGKASNTGGGVGLKAHVHIPKVLYRLMKFSSV